tara:strand:- start:120 stop:1256 length:1137 start_codon:yes stop_codon:yes gene_type:complete
MADEATKAVELNEDLDWDTVEEVSAEADAVANEEISDESSNDESVGDSKEESDDLEADSDFDNLGDNEDSSGDPEPVAEDKSSDEEEAKEPEARKLEDTDEVEIKVDGELTKISVKEFKNGISGEKAIAKRFSEFDRKEKAHQAELDGINTYIADLSKTMNSSVLDGMLQVAELSNISPHAAKQALIKELMPEINRMAGLSDDEIKFESDRQDLDYKTKQYESAQKNSVAQQAQLELQNSINSKREAHNIDDKEWDEAFSYLDTHLEKDKQITVDLIAQKVVFDRAEVKTEKYLSGFDDGKHLTDDTVFEELQTIIMDNPDFTDEDIQILLTDAFGGANASKVEEDLADAVSAKKPKSKKAPKEQSYEEEELPIDAWD